MAQPFSYPVELYEDELNEENQLVVDAVLWHLYAKHFDKLQQQACKTNETISQTRCLEGQFYLLSLRQSQWHEQQQVEFKKLIRSWTSILKFK